MSKFFHISSAALPLLAAVLVLSLSAGYFTLAWSEPSGTMPASVAAPINTSNIAQTKTGSLTLGASLHIPGGADGLVVDSAGGISIYTNELNVKSGSLFLGYRNTSNTIIQANSGNVGIGTTAPAAKLAVGGTGSAGDTIAAYANSANSALYAEQNGTGYAGYFQGKTAFMNGNVGIGTAAPSAKLHVNGTIRSGGSGSYIQLSYPSASTGGIIETGAGQNLFFQTGSNIRMMINGSGNVGIGTTNPVAKLDVNGNIINQGADFVLGTNDGLFKGLKIGQRALVHYNLPKADSLYLNYQGDFEGGVVIDSNASINGNLNVSGTINSDTALCVNSVCVNSTQWNKVINSGQSGENDFTIPAGTLGIDKGLIINFVCGASTGHGAFIKFGGQQLWSRSRGGTWKEMGSIYLRNQGVANSQTGFVASDGSSSYESTELNLSVDTSVDLSITVEQCRIFTQLLPPL